MPRDGDKARKRLGQAALALFGEKGFDQTTVAEIAARAGLTERTFFRHYPDKREVLFDGQAVLAGALSEAIAAVPPQVPPLETLRRAFASICEIFEANRAFAEPRQRIIAATPALQEREVAKGAALTRGVVEALLRRGVDRGRAELAARMGMAALSHGLGAWFAAPERDLRDCLDHAFAEMQDLAAG